MYFARILGAEDKTFFERMMLVFMGHPIRYLLLEEVTEDRALRHVERIGGSTLIAPRSVLTALGVDQPKAFVQLRGATHRVPESCKNFFHVLHALNGLCAPHWPIACRPSLQAASRQPSKRSHAVSSVRQSDALASL